MPSADRPLLSPPVREAAITPSPGKAPAPLRRPPGDRQPDDAAIVPVCGRTLTDPPNRPVAGCRDIASQRSGAAGGRVASAACLRLISIPRGTREGVPMKRLANLGLVVLVVAACGGGSATPSLPPLLTPMPPATSPLPTVTLAATSATS